MSLNRIQLILFAAIGVMVLLAILVLTGVIPGLKERSLPAFTLEIWGFQDEPEVWRTVTEKYGRVNRSATIHYTLKNPSSYETELLNALASGQGPDVFLLKDSWLQKHGDKIKTLPEETLGYQKKNVRGSFIDALLPSIITASGELAGTPLAFDTLALFYNRDYFNSANIPNPPLTWDEFVADVKILTKLTELGSIRRSGAAVGTASNVEHASDILLALIYQSGGTVIDSSKRESSLQHPATQSALTFYTSFANSAKKTYTWNALFENSIQAFAKGGAAMAFGYSSDAKKIAALNPQLNFDAAPLPQLGRKDIQVNYGRFNILAVSRISKEADNAWRFLLWLQNSDAQKAYIDAVGMPPARRDLVPTKPPREYLVPFYDQVLSARSFPVQAGDSVTAIISDMIESVTNRRFTIEQAIERANLELGEKLRRRSQ